MLVAALAACTRSASTESNAAASAPPAVAQQEPGASQGPASPVPVASGATVAPAASVATPAASPAPPLASAANASAAPVGAPSASPPATTVVPSPAATGPRIVSVSATPSVVHDGDTVHWDVRTSPDVVAVSAKVATYGFNLQRSGPGHFTLGFAIPHGVPFFFHRTYTLDVVARDAAGATANTTISLAFQ